MNRKIVAGLLAMATALSLFDAATGKGPRMVAGDEAQQRVFKLSTEIDWHKNLKDALKDAEREGKLVFWVHMLGQIDGAT